MTNRNNCVYQNPIAESIFKEALLLLLCCVRQKLVRGRIRLAGIFLALAPLCGQEVARMALGAAIAVKNDQIRKIKENRYGVRSQTAGSVEHAVQKTARGWSCSCLDYQHRMAYCKHICAVRLLRGDVPADAPKAAGVERDTTAVRPVGDIPESCKWCGKPNIIKKGPWEAQYSKTGYIQQYGCKDCGRRFVFRPGFERMRHDPETIAEALNLYHSGLSYRKNADSAKRRGVSVHYTTVYRWNKKYVDLCRPYLDSLPVHVGDVWNADELFTSVRDETMYFFSLMDGSTRFCPSYDMGDRKDGYNAECLLETGMARAGKIPRVLVSDSLPSYGSAFDAAIVPKARNQECRHIGEARLRGKKNNNIEKRLNGTFRDREKILRGVKKADTPTMSGFVMHYNFVRPHMGLDGRTAARIKIVGRDKWMTIIGNAGMYRLAEERRTANAPAA